ncbi:MAG: tetratricopeptide repeat protein [Syntrophobacteraceae bacterium]
MLETGGSRGAEAVRQQISLWSEEGDAACLERRFIRGIHCYEKALELAQNEGLHDLEGRLCRDLAYVYLHHGAYPKALRLIERGLALESVPPEVRIGLMLNKISALLAEKEYVRGLHETDETIARLLREYPVMEEAAASTANTYDSLRRLRRDVQRIVDLLGSGVDGERIHVDFQLTPPPWETPP